MNLKEAALAAAKSQDAEMRERRREERQKQQDEMLEKWDERMKYAFYDDGSTPPRPDPMELGYGRVATDYKRTSEVYGFIFEVDGIEFIYSTTHGDEGVHVILTCPDCHARRAVHFHGMPDLGKRIAEGRDKIFHHCYDKEARELAYAIGSAARDAQVGVNEIIDRAKTEHGDVIRRLVFGS